MASLDWQLRRTGEVTFVELSVHSDFDQHVCIESRLTPVWPPRQRGVPVAGWSGTTFEAVVKENQPLVFGYASPAEPKEPPAEITATRAPTEETTVTSRDIVRALGEASPPRDVLCDRSLPETQRVTETNCGSETGTPLDSAIPRETDSVSEQPIVPDTAHERFQSNTVHEHTQSNTAHEHSQQTRKHAERPLTAETIRSTGTIRPAEESKSDTTSRSADSRHGVPTDWFDTVESRLSTVETLARASDADEARAVVAELGGIDDVRALQGQLETDRRQLRETTDRAAELTEQLSAVDVPLSTLERIV